MNNSLNKKMTDFVTHKTSLISVMKHSVSGHQQYTVRKFNNFNMCDLN